MPVILAALKSLKMIFSSLIMASNGTFLKMVNIKIGMAINAKIKL